ncbi:hypothetical protein [Ensifer aridi]|uniref:hypothetical protein n=1 Tax=Ensifer aridi TaxID=1708715 RepID=UPI000A106ECB|nr:hypothetical protein [Ensifer aridi]
MTEQQFDAVNTLLGRIADALEMLAGMKSGNGISVANVPNSPWISPNVPAGFNTVVGFLAETHPEVLELMDDPISGTARDGYWLTHRASRDGLPVHKVEAPAPFKEMGIEELNAYPLDLLKERLN